tara:strand:+ start:300 stop:1400 length:1101 start_codon:yes stop_codon:yes gene_type:complete
MVPFDQIFYWNSGVNFADPNDVILGSFQGNSMGSLSSSDPEAATYTNLGIDGYGLTSSSAGDEAYANKWNAIQYKFNGFHESAPLTASLENKAFNGIKIRLKFKISSSWVFDGGYHLRDIQMMHITIKQNDAVLKPSVDHNLLYAGKGSADSRYTWGFVKTTPLSTSDYVTETSGGVWSGFDDILNPSDIPNNQWNSSPRKFTFANNYTGTPSFSGTDRHDELASELFESISSTSLEAFPPHTQGIRPALASDLTFFENHPNLIVIGQLLMTKEPSGFGWFPLRELNFNYSDHLYTTARYLLTNDSPTGNSGSFTIWESDKVIPPGTEFKVTFARNIAAAGSAMHAGTQYYNPSLPYDCRLELIPQ